MCWVTYFLGIIALSTYPMVSSPSRLTVQHHNDWMGRRTKDNLLNKCFGPKRTLSLVDTLSPSSRTTSTAHISIWISFGSSSMEWSSKFAVSDTLSSIVSPLWAHSILREGDASALPSSTSTLTSTDVTAPKSNMVPLAVGLTCGFLALLGVVLGTFWLFRRRRRRAVDPSNEETTHVDPFPPTQAHRRSRWPRESKHNPQRSRWTRESKHTPQRTLSPPGGSTLPSGVSVTATFTSPITTELELPPSYESHMRTGSMATA